MEIVVWNGFFGRGNIGNPYGDVNYLDNSTFTSASFLKFEGDAGFKDIWEVNRISHQCCHTEIAKSTDQELILTNCMPLIASNIQNAQGHSPIYTHYLPKEEEFDNWQYNLRAYKRNRATAANVREEYLTIVYVNDIMHIDGTKLGVEVVKYANKTHTYTTPYGLYDDPITFNAVDYDIQDIAASYTYADNVIYLWCLLEDRNSADTWYGVIKYNIDDDEWTQVIATASTPIVSGQYAGCHVEAGDKLWWVKAPSSFTPGLFLCITHYDGSTLTHTYIRDEGIFENLDLNTNNWVLSNLEKCPNTDYLYFLLTTAHADGGLKTHAATMRFDKDDPPTLTQVNSSFTLENHFSRTGYAQIHVYNETKLLISGPIESSYKYTNDDIGPEHALIQYDPTDGTVVPLGYDDNGDPLLLNNSDYPVLYDTGPGTLRVYNLVYFWLMVAAAEDVNEDPITVGWGDLEEEFIFPLGEVNRDTDITLTWNRELKESTAVIGTNWYITKGEVPDDEDIVFTHESHVDDTDVILPVSRLSAGSSYVLYLTTNLTATNDTALTEQTTVTFETAAAPVVDRSPHAGRCFTKLGTFIYQPLACEDYEFVEDFDVR